jgi:hypothetical protein
VPVFFGLDDWCEPNTAPENSLSFNKVGKRIGLWQAILVVTDRNDWPRPRTLLNNLKVPQFAFAAGANGRLVILARNNFSRLITDLSVDTFHSR